MATESRKNPASQRTASRPARRSVPERAATPELAWQWAIAIFALVTFLFFLKHITGGAFLWDDFTTFTYPNEVFAARNFAAGVMPFWNPYTFNGMPFMADLQIGFFYPGNLLTYIVSGGTLTAWTGQFLIVLHYFIAMVGMWKLARGLGIRSWGAVFAGIAYGLNGMLVVHMIHANMVEHLAWFPLIVYLFHRGLTQRSWLHTLLAGLVLGISLLSGHPQSALYIVVFLFVLTVYLVVRDLRSSDPAARKGLLATLARAALPIAIGVGIFAVQLLPSQELAGLSERAQMDYKKSLEGELGPGQLFTLVVPKIFGQEGAEENVGVPFWYRQEPYYSWETTIYCGVVTLILAAVGLASRRLGGLGWLLAVLALLGVGYALGDNFFVHPLLGRLPLFNAFRIPTRLAIYLSFGAALLAGAGIDRLLSSGEDGSRLSRIGIIMGGLVTVLGLLTVMGMLPSMLDAPAELASALRSAGTVPLLLGAGTTAVVLLAIRGRIPGIATAVLLVLFGAGDLFAFGAGLNNSHISPDKVYADYDTQFASFKVDLPSKIFRVKMRNDYDMAMQLQNQGQYSGIMLYEGYNPLLLQRRVPPGPTLDARLDLLDVAFDLKTDMTARRSTFVPRSTSYPHARMMYDARVLPEDKVEEEMKSGKVDFGRTVVLDEDPGIKTDGSGSGTATITSYSANAIDVAVTGDKPGILLLSEIWYPAWQVTIDGAPAKLLRADYSLRGIAVPAGKHTVSQRFVSSAFSTGLWATIATLALTLGGVVVILLRRRKTAPVA